MRRGAAIAILAVAATAWGGDRTLAQSDAAARPEARTPESKAAKDARRAAAGNLVGHGGPVRAIRLPASGAVFTGSFDYSAIVWDTLAEPPRAAARFDGFNGAVNALAPIDAGSRFLAAGDDGMVSLADVARQTVVHTFNGHEGKVVGVAVSPDERLAATAGWDRTVRIWDLRRRLAGPVLNGHKAPVNAAAFSQDGAFVYTAGADGMLAEWSVADGAFVRAIAKHGWGINVLDRLKGARHLVYGALNGAVVVVELPAGTSARELAPHNGPVLALAVAERSELLATAGGDGRIRVYRTTDWQPVAEHHNPYGPVWALAFHPDGRSLYYGGLDDFVTRWQFSPQAPFEPVLGDFPRRFQVSRKSDGQLGAGEQEFARKCSVCHTLEPDGRNRAGPTLHKIFGRKAGTVPGYAYSVALRNSPIVWSEATIEKLFELGPDEFTPGSKMPLQKITNAESRKALIDYLKAASTPE
jgi:cytochrome c